MVLEPGITDVFLTTTSERSSQPVVGRARWGQPARAHPWTQCRLATLVPGAAHQCPALVRRRPVMGGVVV